jgi:hypothetical protein
MNVTHGATKGRGQGKKLPPEYNSYMAAKMRCRNPNYEHYQCYGGRGIEFRFSSFQEFLACVGPKPSKRHSLDRYPDKNGHYEAGNLRWATKKQQTKNRRRGLAVRDVVPILCECCRAKVIEMRNGDR